LKLEIFIKVEHVYLLVAFTPKGGCPLKLVSHIWMVVGK